MTQVEAGYPLPALAPCWVLLQQSYIQSCRFDLLAALCLFLVSVAAVGQAAVVAVPVAEVTVAAAGVCQMPKVHRLVFFVAPVVPSATLI